MRHEDVVQRGRRPDDLFGDRPAFGLVGIEQIGFGMTFQNEGELPSQIESVLHAAVHPLPAGRRVHVRGIACEKHVSLAEGIGKANPRFPLRMPHHIAHRDCRRNGVRADA